MSRMNTNDLIEKYLSGKANANEKEVLLDYLLKGVNTLILNRNEGTERVLIKDDARWYSTQDLLINLLESAKYRRTHLIDEGDYALLVRTEIAKLEEIYKRMCAPAKHSDRDIKLSADDLGLLETTGEVIVLEGNDVFNIKLGI